jgi:hypothetical protein
MTGLCGGLWTLLDGQDLGSAVSLDDNGTHVDPSRMCMRD